MKRRKVLAGLGSLAAGGAAAMGTGAFSEVQADRTVSVEVVGDNNAYLGLDPTSPYAIIDGEGRLQLDFDGSRKGGEGLNPDAMTSFKGLFEVTNNDGDNIGIYFDTGNPETPRAPGTPEPDFHANLADLLNVSETGLGPGGGRGANYAFFAGGENPDAAAAAPQNTSSSDVQNANSPLILEPGESIEVGFFIIVPEGSTLYDRIEGTIRIWAYDEEVAGLN